MAVQKEIWQRDLVKDFFADNSFASKAVNDDIYVNEGKKVHIPNAGAPADVEVNRQTLPAKTKERKDTDIEYTLDELTTDPVRMPFADTVELSYDKRNSVIAQNKLQLIEIASEILLKNWAPAKENCVETTGTEVNAHTAEATGKRKSLDKKDILVLMTKMDAANLPQEGRYLLLDASMYAQLIESLTETESIGFFAAANVQKGVVGQLYGFNILKRSKVLVYTKAGIVKDVNAKGAADDNAAGLAWHESCVSRALGEVKMFDSLNNPLYYSDIYSFLVRVGGAKRRTDKKGVYAIVQAATV